MKKLMMLAALAVLCVAEAFAAADQVRDGAAFNTPNCQRKYVRRTVDSTGTVAGRMDSAVVICAPNVMPTPITVGGVYETDTTSRALRTTSEGYLRNDDAGRDRDLDFGVTNLVSSVAIDSGGTGGANFRYSAPVDVRKWTSGNIVIHITSASAADTVGTYVYGVTLFPLTSATADWTTVGVPVPVAGNFNTYDGVGTVRDSIGFFRVPLAGAAMDGEKFITLKTDRDNTNYANIEAGKTVSIPWQYWLGPFARPRYLMLQIRLASKSITGNLTPSVRADLEGLR